MKRVFRMCGAIVTIAGLFGCGGGGGSSSGPPAGVVAPVAPTPTPLATPAPSATPTSAPSATPGPMTSITAAIVADANAPGTPMTHDQLGVNYSVLVPDTATTTLTNTLRADGVGMVRYPGGTISDNFHPLTSRFGSCAPNLFTLTTFDSLVQTGVRSGGFDLAVTVNYGANATCNGGADPNEAASLVDYANNTQHYGVKYWTIGNEQYFNCCNIDFNVPAHDAPTYASRVANQFYPMMKAKDPTIQIGIDVAAGSGPFAPVIANWDQTVHANAKYDFVEMHYYPEFGPNDNDMNLLTTGASTLATRIQNEKNMLAANGHAGAPILLGEFDADSGGPNPGKQSVSIVNALFTGMVLGEVVNAGVPMATLWLAADNCYTTGGNNSSSLYGWQNFGTSGAFSSSTPANFGNSCLPLGLAPLTPFPKARALLVASQFVIAGERPLSLTNSANLVRAYAATQGNGYAFMLFNLDQNNATTQTIGVRNTVATQFNATTMVYGKAQYDQSQTGTWGGPVSANLGTVANPFQIALPPWSMTVVKLVATSMMSAHRK